MQAVELAIVQGVTDLKESLGRRQAVAELHRRADLLRAELRDLEESASPPRFAFDLGPSQLGRDYVKGQSSTALVEIDDLAESDVSGKLTALLRAYASLFVNGRLAFDAPPSTSSPHALMVYVGERGTPTSRPGEPDGWWGWKNAPTDLDALRPGDLIAFGRGFSGGSSRVDAEVWQQHHLHEVVIGRVITTPERTDQLVMPDECLGSRISVETSFRAARCRHGRTARIRRSLQRRGGSEGLRRSAIVSGMGVLAPVAGSPLLEAYMAGDAKPVDASPIAVAALGRSFVEAVENAGLRFRSDDVLAFVAAMLAKPFAILTGQSGSGKTQLAKRLGEWFGADHHGRRGTCPSQSALTGPDPNTSSAIPMLCVRRRTPRSGPSPARSNLCCAPLQNLGRPTCLLLDEMNLAHVERYFADFLSGVESGDPVLPELRQTGRPMGGTGSAQRLPIPRNLVRRRHRERRRDDISVLAEGPRPGIHVRIPHDAPMKLDPSLRRPAPTTPAEAQIRRGSRPSRGG